VRLGAFPSPARAQVVVAHVGDPAGDVGALARDADAAAAEAGVERETRPFRPHITLARPLRKVDARAWLDREIPGGDPIRPTRVTLFRSDLAPNGSVYVPLARFPFAPP
jgi:2'-5' RNA ligase